MRCSKNESFASVNVKAYISKPSAFNIFDFETCSSSLIECDTACRLAASEDKLMIVHSEVCVFVNLNEGTQKKSNRLDRNLERTKCDHDCRA
jgi:hypothetical protein